MSTRGVMLVRSYGEVDLMNYLLEGLLDISWVG